jgi:nucleotide-binding universal stress UspA family protein
METDKKSILLVPTDFSDIAQHALEYAVNVAKLFNDEIVLLFINDIGSALSAMFSNTGNNTQRTLIHEAVEHRYNKLSDQIAKEHGVKVSLLIKDSHSIYKTIVDTADEVKCESIVMGTHGVKGIKNIIGSNASRVISHAKVPVIVVKQKHFGDGYKSIVFPVDLHMESRQKIGRAVQLAKKFDSTIHVITYKKSDEFLRQMVAHNMQRVEARFKEAGVKYTIHYLEGSAHFENETIKYAEKLNADLILIMTQHEEGIAEYIIGSTAQQIVNHSSIPVMTITPAAIGSIDSVGY